MPDMYMGNVMTYIEHISNRPIDRPVSRAPTNNSKPALCLARFYRLLGNIVGNVINFSEASIRHLLVVRMIVGNIARVVVLFDATNTVS